eukprot:2858439-Rhodomonas_salina.1
MPWTASRRRCRFGEAICSGRGPRKPSPHPRSSASSLMMASTLRAFVSLGLLVSEDARGEACTVLWSAGLATYMVSEAVSATLSCHAARA